MRDFVSVHDVVQANLLAMERAKADGMALNIGSGSPFRLAMWQTSCHVPGREDACRDHRQISRRRYSALLRRYHRRAKCWATSRDSDSQMAF